MKTYPIGTKLLREGFEGVVITSDELMSLSPKFILPEDVCVKWSNQKGAVIFASTYDKEWLDENCLVPSDETDKALTAVMEAIKRLNEIK
jgi:hypothetical protein